MRIVVTAGGTGGHIYPASTFALYAHQQGADIAWVGSEARMEKTLVEGMGIPFHGFHIERPSEHILWLPHDIHAWLAVRAFLKSYKPDCVVAAGGYISFFAVSAARNLGIPYFLMEQNAVPGRVTRMMQRKAVHVCTAFEESIAWLTKKKNVIVTGNPVRSDIKTMRSERDRCVIMGGSLGARAVNNAAVTLLNEGFFERNEIPVLWITGSRDYDTIRAALKPNVAVELCEYRHDMDAVYAKARCMIARAGAMTVSECAVAGVPMVMVPYPYAKDDHQKMNAEAVAHRGGGIVIDESATLTEDIRGVMEQLWQDDAKLTSMSTAIRTLMPANAEALIWKAINETI